MQIDTTVIVTYSPTGTTHRVCEAIAAGLAAPAVTRLDLTPAGPYDGVPTRLTDGVAVIGVPVYTGRVAAHAVERLRSIRAADVPAVLVVVYGNRAYEDALVELRDLAVAAGFRPVAVAAFVGEHSYSRPEAPLAAGRPDADDLRKARELGESVARRLAALSSVTELESPEVPGTVPYKDRSQMPALTPEWLADRCSGCGRCVEVCPTGAIPADGTAADVGLCTLCCACVKVCPEQARVLAGPWMDAVSAALTKACATRDEPEIHC